MQLYRRKPAAPIEAMTWEEFIAYGLAYPGASIVAGVPWSFRIGNDQAVTHERDDLYLLSVRGGTEHVKPNTLIVFHPFDGTASTVRADTYEPVRPAPHPDDLPPRVTYDPVRSIDFRITADCPNDSRFVPVVVAALRAIAAGLESDEQRPWYGLKQEAPAPSGFSELTGDVTMPLDYGRYTARIQWAAATKLDLDESPDDPPPADDDIDAVVVDTSRATAEELASLTDAEREALGHVWRVSRIPTVYGLPPGVEEENAGWRADNGETVCNVWLAGYADADTIGRFITQTLRNGGIIAENQQITIIFEEQP